MAIRSPATGIRRSVTLVAATRTSPGIHLRCDSPVLPAAGEDLSSGAGRPGHRTRRLPGSALRPREGGAPAHRHHDGQNPDEERVAELAQVHAEADVGEQNRRKGPVRVAQVLEQRACAPGLGRSGAALGSVVAPPDHLSQVPPGKREVCHVRPRTDGIAAKEDGPRHPAEVDRHAGEGDLLHHEPDNRQRHADDRRREYQYAQFHIASEPEYIVTPLPVARGLRFESSPVYQEELGAEEQRASRPKNP